MEVKPEYEEFINSFWLFTKHKSVSYPVREAYNQLLNGLGLPLLRGYRRSKVFGYVAHPTNKYVLVPVDKDLLAYYRAQVMYDSKEYFARDIIAWINSCNPNIPMTLDIWKFNISINKRLYKEILKPVSHRISIVTNGHELTQTSSEEEDEEGDFSEGQTSGSGAEEEKGRAVS